MGLFRPTQYFRPETADEVTSILIKHKETALVVGGGTEIYELAQRGLLSNIEALVDLGKLSLNRIVIEEGQVRLGASVTLSEIERKSELFGDPGMTALEDALRQIRPVQVKNTATVGGAICSCMPFFDLPVALAALDASVHLRGEHGGRAVPLLDFQLDFLQPDLQSGEFLEEAVIPRGGFHASAFSKFSETGDDWAIVNCGCAVAFESGRIKKARIVFGAVSSKSFLAQRSAEATVGESTPQAATEKALKELEKELIEPNSDNRASSAYRKRVAKALLQETIERVFSRMRRSR